MGDKAKLFLTLISAGSMLTSAGWGVYGFFHRIKLLEKANELNSYVLRSCMIEHPKGSKSGVKFSIWETPNGLLWFYDEYDRTFYTPNENPIDHTWSVVAEDGNSYDCKDRVK